MPELSGMGERIFLGIPVSAGVCRGKALVLGQTTVMVARQTVPAEELPRQLDRLEQAIVATREQIRAVHSQVASAMGNQSADIFEAHLLVLEDHALFEEVNRFIQQEKVTAEFAFSVVAERYVTALAAVDDDYLKERASDLRDVIHRMLDNLTDLPTQLDPPKLQEPCIIVSEDLSPSMTAQLDRNLVLGFATDVGSKTSHTAILARSLQIPAVVGLAHLSRELRTDQYILLDGFNGRVIVNPTDQTLLNYGQLEQEQHSRQAALRDLRDLPAITLDGHRFRLSANAEHVADTEAVLAYGAEGIGLFRTEFLFIQRQGFPDEEEQYRAYRHVAATLKPHPVIIRTLDLGGDKFLSRYHQPPELNPSLGWRGIRFCLQAPNLFRQQLRAILRASAEGNVKLMYPMVSGLAELEQANALLAECQAELRAQNVPFDPQIEVGIMIEVPAAAMIADSLARRVKFFSLGTNDLIQYTLAADRVNEKIAHLYEPTHPAILRLIQLTVAAGHRQGIWVGVCGEMASDPALTPLLLGLGVDELSAAASLVPPLKYLIRRLKLTDAQTLAHDALACESSVEILARSQALALQTAPRLFDNQNEMT